VFETEPLASPLEVVGPIGVRLWVGSSALDSDVVVKLIDVYPDGFAMNLSEAILRLRFRNGFERAEPLVPGQIYEVTLEPQPIGNLFAAGHRIRLDVQGSHFPQWDVNPLPAEIAVFHDAVRPSHVLLPVVVCRTL
jgi:putative CocE/NonD family hydrolase